MSGNILYTIFFDNCKHTFSSSCIYDKDKKTNKHVKLLYNKQLKMEIRVVGTYPKGFIGALDLNSIVKRLTEINEKRKEGKELDKDDLYFYDMFKNCNNPVLFLFNF